MMVMEYPGGSAINCYVFTVNEIIFFLTKEQTDTGYIFQVFPFVRKRVWDGLPGRSGRNRLLVSNPE